MQDFDNLITGLSANLNGFLLKFIVTHCNSCFTEFMYVVLIL